jgi:hypothetical protein
MPAGLRTDGSSSALPSLYAQWEEIGKEHPYAVCPATQSSAQAVAVGPSLENSGTPRVVQGAAPRTSYWASARSALC